MMKNTRTISLMIQRLVVVHPVPDLGQHRLGAFAEHQDHQGGEGEEKKGEEDNRKKRVRHQGSP